LAWRRRWPPPDLSESGFQQVLEAFAVPVRRGIAEAPIACSTFDLLITKPTATCPFKGVKEARLIRQYCAATSRVNALRKEEAERAFSGLTGAVVAALDKAG
jgi:hypothetical protein